MDLRPYLAAAADVADVSGELGEGNPANRLYRLQDGQIIKVKCYPNPAVDTQPANARVFQMKASLCDETGAADVETIGELLKAVCFVTPAGPSIEAQLDETRRAWAIWSNVRHLELQAEPAGVAPLSAVPPAGFDGAALAVAPDLAALVDVPAAAEPAAAVAVDERHPSGRRYVLFPGNVRTAEGETVFVDTADLCAAYGVKLGQCVVFSDKRPADYFAGLVELYPHPPGTYPALDA